MSDSDQPIGRVMYLLIPSDDPQISADFYAKVFGWRIRTRSDGTLAFEDSHGGMIGAWETGMRVPEDQGFTLFIGVNEYAATERRIQAHGGVLIERADPDQFDVIGRFRDPFGNIFGYYELKPEER